jgi:3-phenylpropionate/cinnamic acid dioxygenase small subunit
MSQHGSVDPRIVDFIFTEAKYADEAQYSEWLALWHEKEAMYWVPMREGADPEKEVSYIYDNWPRISKRIGQLKTGSRHSQTPPSKMRRIISNFEVIASDDVSTTVASNFMLLEYRFALTTWAGRCVHRIRTDGDELKMATKTVHLINGSGAISTMSFII